MPSPEALKLYDEAAALPGDEVGVWGTVDRDWRPLRQYKPGPGSEGRQAFVYVQRTPAQFYMLRCGDLVITTGTGCELGLLLCKLAEQVAAGTVLVGSPRFPLAK